MNRLIKYISPFIAVTVLLASFMAFHANRADAINDGRLMDDVVFDNTNSMSEQAIRDFINSRPGTCLAASGAIFPEPKNYFDYGPNNVDAARVIYVSAQKWRLNPQVIIATLQKEQTLITDNDCYDPQGFPSLPKAMGMGCFEGPNEPCPRPEYEGLSRQVMKGSWQLKFNKERAVGNVMWNSEEGDQYISYSGPYTEGNRKDNVDAPSIYRDGYWLIDGQNVRMETGATASLYRYTPHLGQSFPSIFQNWFGSLYGETNVTNTNWLFEDLEGTNATPYNQLDSNVGQQPASIVFGGDLHIFHYDATGGNLRHAYHDTSWNFETLDGTGGGGGKLDADVGKTPVVISDGTTALHLFYYDATNGDLRHAWSDSTGNNWTFETLDGAGAGGGRSSDRVGLNPSATSYANTLQLFYYDITHGNLRHAWLNGTGWHFENLDGDPGSIAGLNSNLGDDPVVLNYTQGSSLQLFYYDISNGNLRHGWNNASGWHFENLDGTPNSLSGSSNADTGRWTAATVYNGHLQMFYYDITHGNLRHAWTSSKGWHFENLDGDPGAVFGRNYNTGITPVLIANNNILYLFYYDPEGGDLRHGYSDNTGWHIANLDGNYSSVACVTSNQCDTLNRGVDPTVTVYDGYLQLFYYDSTGGNLRHAWGLAP